MTRSARSLLMAIRPDILFSFCHRWRIRTERRSKEQIIARLSQDQALTILSSVIAL